MVKLDLQEVSSLTVTTLIDNSIDSLLVNQGPAIRQPLISRDTGVLRDAPLFDKGNVAHELRAEHAFSLLVDYSINGEDHRILMDTGRTTDGLVTNLDCLGIDPISVEAVVLSHGHGDHSGGLNGLYSRLAPQFDIPVFAHPDAFLRTRNKRRDGGYNSNDTMDLNAFQRAGIDVVLTPEAQEIRPGVAVTGQVPRLTTFEVTGSALTEKMKAGEWIADEILDEQATVFSLKDKGLVVLTGCSHCGVINAVRHAQKITGVHRVYAVLGGFHLSGKRAEPAVEPTVAALEELKPEYVVPSHCSGFNAASLISSRMPDAFIPNSVGTRFQFA